MLLLNLDTYKTKSIALYCNTYMAWLLILNSLLFVATLTEYLICMKYINLEYDYKNEWFNVLLSLVFTPFYSCFFIHKFSWSKIKSYTTRENRHLLLYPVGTGILYTIETVTVFFALNTITLSYYTILRSGFIIFNIPWFKYLLKKPVTRIYVASCVSLVIAQFISTAQYISKYSDSNGNSNSKSNVGQNVIQNAFIVMVSCFLNATYNNLIEYSMALYGTQMQTIDFQIIFQCTYLLIAAPFAVVYTVKHTPPINVSTITMYFFIAFGLQLYMFNKIYILNSSKEGAIPANILLSGLDLLRRVIQLTYSFVCFKEPFDTIIGISLVFLGLSAGLLLYQYISDHRKASQTRHVKMLELEEESNLEKQIEMI
jgi:drug/metabolite transporter (DMT)-like permease